MLLLKKRSNTIYKHAGSTLSSAKLPKIIIFYLPKLEFTKTVNSNIFLKEITAVSNFKLQNSKHPNSPFSTYRFTFYRSSKLLNIKWMTKEFRDQARM